MLEKPRLLDFDNKRAHVRARLRRVQEDPHAHGHAHGHGAHGASVRISISRTQVLMDSFTQLRFRNPAEMRGRLTIQAGRGGSCIMPHHPPHVPPSLLSCVTRRPRPITRESISI